MNAVRTFTVQYMFYLHVFLAVFHNYFGHLTPPFTMISRFSLQFNVFIRNWKYLKIEKSYKTFLENISQRKNLSQMTETVKLRSFFYAFSLYFFFLFKAKTFGYFSFNIAFGHKCPSFILLINHLLGQKTPGKRSGDSSNTGVIVGSVIGALAVIIIILVLLICWKKRQQRKGTLIVISSMLFVFVVSLELVRL